ncbi:Nramp family divalent metal transporter [Mucilaginibacter myungsuensis]|uniref:Divalent metal cation transporter MntH n=1 Tax=Mucilaginibacter myungsuensis TaxID=649104 RepID=A0A929KXQ4_9SPHI|nr:Nramp family divalent metal transporter [Mucilaginibacter myungsuensis]MBE9662582.1 Nramp family divalent metal transporter [Mucilaginibacter myungsuensis]MDN3598002.1 Nramp family divalent metal transporter [Mucilaginibacter myungsuensis]
MTKKVSGESLGGAHGSVDTNKQTGWKRFLAFIGPAYLVSVGYMDPGNWATDIAGGSAFGYKLIWVLLASNLIALVLQSLSARLGIVRGLDLAQASKHSYPPFVNFWLYILAQLAIIACDLAEIIGMAIGLKLLFNLPLIWGVSLTITDTVLMLWLMNKGMRKLEAFIVAMIFIIGLSFLVEMFIVKPDVIELAKGFIPNNLFGGDKVHQQMLYIAIGIIGATVMPHNLYLHSSLVQTRRIERTDEGIASSIKFNFFDTVIALNLAFFVNAAILILAASAFFRNGFYEVAEIQDAYKLLENIFGSVAPTLFAVALIASGQSSTITGTLAGQIIMEGHINLRIEPWLRRLLTRALAIIPAVFTILYYGEEGLGDLIILSQVVLSLQLGFAVIPLIHFTSDKKRMGKFAIGIKTKIFAWASSMLIVALNAKLVVDQVHEWIQETGGSVWMYALVLPIVIGIALLLIYVFIRPLIFKYKETPIYVPHGLAEALDDIQPITYHHIGITIDFSNNDRDSIRHALMQGGKKAHYTLIHVVETAGARYHGTEVMDHETQSDVDNLDKYIHEIRKMGYRVEPRIGYGFPANAIVGLVEKEKIDFLVMGSHGHKVLKDLIYGSTVDKVRHNVKVPVLIVKGHK